MLLGHLLNTLAVIMECSRYSLDIHRMVTHLLQYIWMFRFSDHASVRIGCLTCLSAIIRACGRNSSILSTGSPTVAALAEFGAWIAAVCSKDPDPKCRHIATMIAKTEAIQRAQKAIAWGIA